MKKELITLTAIAATGLATTVSANEVAEPNVNNAGGVRTAQTEPALLMLKTNQHWSRKRHQKTERKFLLRKSQKVKWTRLRINLTNLRTQ